MSLAKEGFSFGSRVTATAVVNSAGMDEGVRVGSRQAFFEGVGLTTMDLDKRLRCLSQNSTLRLETISSSSFSSSQIIGSASQLTPIFGSSLKDEENEDDEIDEEDEDAGDGVLTLWT